jgi:PHD/YefM family antitoxin component YafN of YafNO toxin-antitoxin module
MPTTKPVSDLRNNYPEIEKLIQNEEVFLTKNGIGTSVIMNIEEYDKLKARLEIYQKLGEAEADIVAGDNGKDFRTCFKEMRKKING